MMQQVDGMVEVVIAMQKILSAAPVFGIVVLLIMFAIAVVGIVCVGREE